MKRIVKLLVVLAAAGILGYLFFPLGKSNSERAENPISFQGSPTESVNSSKRTSRNTKTDTTDLDTPIQGDIQQSPEYRYAEMLERRYTKYLHQAQPSNSQTEKQP